MDINQPRKYRGFRVALAALGMAVLSCVPAVSATAATSTGTTAPGTTAPGTTAPGTTVFSVGTVDALASDINLVPGDLPGWRHTTTSTAKRDQAEEVSIEKCAGAPNPAKTIVAQVESLNFVAGKTYAFSNFQIAATPQLALDGLQTQQTPQLLACVRKIVPAYIKAGLPKGLSVANAKASALVVAGAPASSVGYRVVTTLKIATGELPLTLNSTTDVVWFVLGRAEIELNMTQVGESFNLLDSEWQQHLLGLLVTRAQRYNVTLSQ